MRTRKEVELTRRIQNIISSERFQHLILRTGIALALLFIGIGDALNPILLQTKAVSFGKYIPFNPYNAFFAFSIITAVGGGMLLVGIMEGLILLLTFIISSGAIAHYALARSIPPPILFVLAAATIIAWGKPETGFGRRYSIHRSNKKT